MKIMLIAGARPNFMKIASIVDAIEAYNRVASSKIDCFLVHTGQHYDEQMSDSFFRDLNLPRPDVNLGVGSASHACQTADIMKCFEPILLRERPDVLLVVGDVNSTVACALVASKITYPAINVAGRTRPLIVHVEAGLRSFDRSMPEEINRIVTDALSDVLFTSEEGADQNLLREGIPQEKIHFAGNTMVDTLLKHKTRADQSKILSRLGLMQDEGVPPRVAPYVVVTLHRPSNVDNGKIFQGILKALTAIGATVPVLFPIHPRTLNRIKEFQFEDDFDFSHLGLVLGSQASAFNRQISTLSPQDCILHHRIVALDPLGYFDFLCLMSHARLVLTDSGGIQEETTVLGVPCVTLRENTERPITVVHGTNVVAGLTKSNITQCALNQLKRSLNQKSPKLWDGHAGERIINVLAEQIHESSNSVIRNHGFYDAP
jgi:UDP-N-acetylglucosamine 2-epimerase (non-hydrolysing)